MINVTVVSVDFDDRRGHWRIGQTVDDGSGALAMHLHLIPPRAVVEHAAEYGLDPADSRPVLDWLLHERFVRHPDVTNLRYCSPYHQSPQEAWVVHLANSAEVKTRVSITDPDGHLEKIHQAHNPTPEHILAARDRVAQVRAHVAHIEGHRRS